jgi:hypothetical protein
VSVNNSAETNKLVLQASVLALDDINELAKALRANMRERGDYAQSLQLIAGFFAKGGDNDIALYIGRIASAFYDRADGVSDPILSRQKKKKDDPTYKWIGRKWAALAFECLLKAGMSQPEAAKHIARKHPDLNRLLRGKRELKTSVRGWYEEFMGDGRTPPKAVLESFKRIHKALKLGPSHQLAKEEYQRQADDCLVMAKGIAAELPSEP